MTPRVAVVTGAGRGVGEAVSRGLARDEVAVALLGRNQEALGRVATRIRADGGRALPIACDVRSRTDVVAAIDLAGRELGPLGLLVNNAAVDLPAPGASVDPAALDESLSVNLAGALWCCQAAFAQLRQTRGSVVNVSSIAARVGLPGVGAYGATKAAIEQLTRTLAIEWAPFGVRVNAVAPGFLSHAMAGSDRGYRDLGLAKAPVTVPLGRLGEPEDLVGPVTFLASPGASYVTGAVLRVDGGYTAGRIDAIAGIDSDSPAWQPSG